MPRLIFDIETSALPLDHFDEAQQEYLFRECGKIEDELQRSNRRSEITRQCSLWPFTAQVVCIAMLNADTSRGQVLFTAEDCEDSTEDAGPVEFVKCGATIASRLSRAIASSIPARAVLVACVRAATYVGSLKPPLVDSACSKTS